MYKNTKSYIKQVREAKSTKQQLYGHLPPISKTIQIRWTRHTGHGWRSKNKLISDLLQWRPSHGRASVGRPARTKIQQLCTDIGCSLEDLSEAMDDRDERREWLREIRARSMTWHDIYIYIYIYIYIHTYMCVCVCVCVCDLKWIICEWYIQWASAICCLHIVKWLQALLSTTNPI